jgi:hypothetical protein
MNMTKEQIDEIKADAWMYYLGMGAAYSIYPRLNDEERACWADGLKEAAEFDGLPIPGEF